MGLSNVHKQISFAQCTSLFSTIRSINPIIHNLIVIFMNSIERAMCMEQEFVDLVLIPKRFG